MSWEVIGDSGESLGQFASNAGYADLAAAVEDDNFSALKEFFLTGETKSAIECAIQLRQLTGADDVVATATGLADVIEDQEHVTITDGSTEEDDSSDVEKYSPDQPRDERGRWGEGSGDAIMFTSDSSIEDSALFLENLNSTWKMTVSEHKALDTYTDTGFKTINKYLRLGASSLGISFNVATSVDVIISTIDSALNKFTVPEAIVVYRGVNVGGRADTLLTPGAIFKDPAFVSTTMHPSKAEYFGERLVAIYISKGAKGGPIDGEHSNPLEQEFLLPRNSRFEVMGRGKDDVINVRLLL